MVKGILLVCLGVIVAGMALPRQAAAFDVGVGPLNFHVPEGRGGYYGPRYGHGGQHSTHTAKKKSEEKGEEVQEQPKAADPPKQTTEIPAQAEPPIPAGHGPDLTPER